MRELAIFFHVGLMWHFIFERIPTDRDVLLAVLDREAFHTLEFPCRLSDDERVVWSTCALRIGVHGPLTLIESG
jgi:hypothetical protein